MERANTAAYQGCWLQTTDCTCSSTMAKQHDSTSRCVTNASGVGKLITNPSSWG